MTLMGRHGCSEWRQETEFQNLWQLEVIKQISMDWKIYNVWACKRDIETGDSGSSLVASRKLKVDPPNLLGDLKCCQCVFLIRSAVICTQYTGPTLHTTPGSVSPYGMGPSSTSPVLTRKILDIRGRHLATHYSWLQCSNCNCVTWPCCRLFYLL